MNDSTWLGLMIGNSRLHWARFQHDILQYTWDMDHYSDRLNNSLTENLPLYVASVVPSQTLFWQNYPHIKLLTLSDIPLNGLYPTLGIDRALAVLGAGINYGFPCLVIDAGTALTYTGVNGDRLLIGGSILPGLGLQLQSLATQTAALPDVSLPLSLPPRWATTTPEAIKSGVIYTLLAGLRDFIQQWRLEFPNAQIVLTGGDGKALLSYLQSYDSKGFFGVSYEQNLIFLGMREIVIHSGAI